MKIYEMHLKVYVMKSIAKEEILEQISKLTDSCLVKNGFKTLHEENTFKFYTFSGFYPVEKSGIYQEGKIYTVTIRTVLEQLKEVFCNTLANEQTSYIKALTITSRCIKQKVVEKIYSLTPCVIRFDQEAYWRDNHSVEEFESRLKVGLIKKYNQLFNTRLDEDFEWYIGFTIDNHKPIASAYKDIKLLGDKITLEVAPNEVAQQLAWLAIGTSIGELGARGFGFVNFRYL